MHLSDSLSGLLFLRHAFKFVQIVSMQEAIIWKEEFVCVYFNTALATLRYMSVLTCQVVT